MGAWLHVSDWWSGNSEAHPLAVGSAVILLVFLWIRLTGTRSLAGITIFDWILSVALGSTISRIITQPELDFTRGVLSCFVILALDWVSSFMCASVPGAERLIKHDPALLVFRGRVLDDMLRKNRIHISGVYHAMRQRGIANVKDVEAVVLEGNGSFSTIPKTPSMEFELPDALSTVPLYVKLRAEWEGVHGREMSRVGEHA